MNFLNLVREQFNDRVAVKEKRPGIYQIFSPFYHEDGDMVEIYLEMLKDGFIRVSDYGMTVMRLSYSYDLDTSKKMEVFNKILSENQVNSKEGNLFVDTKPELLYGAITQFAQVIAKISSMRLYKKEMIRSMFYEMVKEFVASELDQYHPKYNFQPIGNRPELEVDYLFNDRKRPLYLFAVKDDNKAKMVTISCLEFLNAAIPFKSAVVYEDFESLSRTDKKLILSRTDKSFPDFDDFKSNSQQYLTREFS